VTKLIGFAETFSACWTTSNLGCIQPDRAYVNMALSHSSGPPAMVKF
jgi:hypothetical protein